MKFTCSRIEKSIQKFRAMSVSPRRNFAKVKIWSTKRYKIRSQFHQTTAFRVFRAIYNTWIIAVYCVY